MYAGLDSRLNSVQDRDQDKTQSRELHLANKNERDETKAEAHMTKHCTVVRPPTDHLLYIPPTLK